MPAPSPESLSPPQPPLCSMQSSPLKDCFRIQLLSSPFIFAINPTPQASFSPDKQRGEIESLYGFIFSLDFFGIEIIKLFNF